MGVAERYKEKQTSGQKKTGVAERYNERQTGGVAERYAQRTGQQLPAQDRPYTDIRTAARSVSNERLVRRAEQDRAYQIALDNLQREQRKHAEETYKATPMYQRAALYQRYLETPEGKESQYSVEDFDNAIKEVESKKAADEENRRNLNTEKNTLWQKISGYRRGGLPVPQDIQDRYDEIDAALRETNTYDEEIGRLQAGKKRREWNDLRNNEDFAEKSVYNPSLYNDYEHQRQSLGDDPYEYINANPEVRERIKANQSYGIREDNGWSQYDSRDWSGYDNLPQDVKDTYNYIYNTRGKNEANEYLSSAAPLKATFSESLLAGITAPVANALSIFDDDIAHSAALENARVASGDYSWAYKAGSTASNIASMLLMGKGFSAVGKALGVSSNLASGAVYNALTMGSQSALSQVPYLRTGQITPEEFGRSVGVNAIAGAAASISSGLISTGINNVLVQKGLQTRFNNYLTNAASSSAYAATNTLTQNALSKKKMTDEELAWSLVEGFAYSLISSAVRTGIQNRQTAQYVERLQKELNDGWEEITKTASQSTGGDNSRAQAIARELLAKAQEGRAYIEQMSMPGQQSAKNDILAGYDLLISNFNAIANGLPQSTQVPAAPSNVVSGIQNALQAGINNVPNNSGAVNDVAPVVTNTVPVVTNTVPSAGSVTSELSAAPGASNISKADLDRISGEYDGSTDEIVYSRGMVEGYNYGLNGYPKDQITADGFYNDLTPAQKEYSYALGQNAAAKNKVTSADTEKKLKELGVGEEGITAFKGGYKVGTDFDTYYKDFTDGYKTGTVDNILELSGEGAKQAVVDGFSARLRDEENRSLPVAAPEARRADVSLETGKSSYTDIQSRIEALEDAQARTNDPAEIDRIEKEIEELQSSAVKETAVEKYNSLTYDGLSKKKAVQIVSIPSFNKAASTRSDVIANGLKNAASVGRKISDTQSAVYVDDIKTEVKVSAAALKHGLDRRIKSNSGAFEKIGEVLKNSIRINESNPDNENIKNTYVLVGTTREAGHDPSIVISMVNRNTNDVEDVYSLHSSNKKEAKKKESAANSPSVAVNPIRDSDSTTSIESLLGLVNSIAPDILPEDVLKRFGYPDRPPGKYGERMLFEKNALDRIVAGHQITLDEYARSINSQQVKTERGQIVKAVTDAQKQAQLIDKNGTRTIALGIVDNFVEKGAVDYESVRLDTKFPEIAASQVAAYGMLLRDPRFETFRILFTKGDRIISVQSFTSRLVDRAYITKGMMDSIIARRNDLKASGYYLMHNHPSGDPSESGADIATTRKFSQMIPGFKGHIIVDHNKYSYLNASGYSQGGIQTIAGGKAETFEKRIVDHPLLYDVFNDPDKLAQAAVDLVHSKDVGVLMYCDTKGKLRAIEEVKNTFMKSTDAFGQYLADRKTQLGSSRAYLLMSEGIAWDDAAYDLQHLFLRNLIFDIIDRGGRSMYKGDSGLTVNIGGRIEDINGTVRDRMNYNPDGTIGEKAFEVKEEFDLKENAEQTIKKASLSPIPLPGNTETTKAGHALFAYNVADIAKEINPSDRNIIKYLPDGLLDAEKRAVKQAAIFDKTSSLIIKEESPYYAGPAPSDALASTRKELNKALRELKGAREKADYWKGQTKLTKFEKLTDRSVKALADQYAENTELNKKELAAEIKDLGEWAINQPEGFSLGAFRDRVRKLAVKLGEAELPVFEEYWDDSFKEVADFIKASKISVRRSDLPTDFFKKGGEGRKKFNKLHISISEQGDMDSWYQEAHSMYPYLFPEDITNPADQLEHVLDLLDNVLVPEKILVPTDPTSEEYIDWRTEEIMADMVDLTLHGKEKPTFADRKEAEKKEAVAQAKQEVRAQEAGKRKEALDKLREQAKDHEQQALDKLREKREKQIQSLKDHYKEIQKNARERKIESADRTRLLNVARRLSKLKTYDVTKDYINSLIGDLDLVSKGITKRSLEDLVSLEAWYDNEVKSNPDFIPDKITKERLNRLSKTRISNMDIQDVRDLTDALLNIEHALSTSRKFHNKQIRIETYQAGLNTITDLENSGGVKNQSSKRYSAALSLLRPETLALKLVGYNRNSPLYQLTRELSKGENKRIAYQNEAEEMLRPFTSDKDFVKFINSERIEIGGLGENGNQKAVITPNLRMSLYMHSRNDANMRHIMNGGINVPDYELLSKGKTDEAYAKSTKIKLTPTQVRAITLGMTPKERAFADLCRNYYENVSKPALNEVSNDKLGYSIAKVDNYYRIPVDKNFLETNFGELKEDGTVDGMGFLKERQEDATIPMNLVGLMETINQDIRMHAKYVGLSIPVGDFNRLMSMMVMGYETSVMDTLERMWGRPAHRYIDDLLTQLQGNGPKSSALDTVRSKYASAVLLGNVGVMIKQAASYPTAAAVLGWGPLTKAMGNIGKLSDHELAMMRKYSPMQIYREKGYGTIELGDIAARKGRVPKLLQGIQKVDILTTRKLFKACEYYVRSNMPEIKYNSEEFWQAVGEMHTKVIENTQPNYTTMQRPAILRSKNQMTRALVMFKTQPMQNYNILYESLGEMIAKHRAYKNGGSEADYKQARRGFARGYTSIAVSTVVFAAMQLLWDMFRHKTEEYEDEGEMTIESVAKGLGIKSLASLAGMLPFGGEVLTIIENRIDNILAEAGGEAFFNQTEYDLSAPTIDAFNSLKTGIEALLDNSVKLSNWDSMSGAEREKVLRKIESALEGVGQFAGIPAANVRKLLTALIVNTVSPISGKYMADYVQLRIEKAPAQNKNAYFDLLYEAYKNDRKAYDMLYEDMIGNEAFETSTKSAQDNVDKAIKDRIKADESKSEDETADDWQKVYDHVSQRKGWENLSVDQQTKLEQEIQKWAEDTGFNANYDKYLNGEAPDESLKDTTSGKIISGGEKKGVDAIGYFSYLSQLMEVDRPNGNGNLGSYDKNEIANALSKTSELNDTAKQYIWETKYPKSKLTYNEYIASDDYKKWKNNR